MNIFLIGYRCTGKSSVGRALARRLDWSFVDTDRIVVDTAGVSIARMVAADGWPSFRARERRVLQSVAAGDRQVVATGGGIVLDDRNIALMRQSGKMVWLTASGPTIAARMNADAGSAADRPSLTGRGRIDEIEAVLTERTPRYADAADLVVDTDRAAIAAVCDRIVDELKIAACHHRGE